MAGIGKGEIAQQVAERTGLPRTQATKAVDALVDVVQGALAQGDEVRIAGFGSWKVAETKARMGRNPLTGESIDIQAGRRVSFSAGSKLSDSIRASGADDGSGGGGQAAPAKSGDKAAAKPPRSGTTTRARRTSK